MVDVPPEPAHLPADDPLPANIRKRLQTLFEHGQQKHRQGEHAYAHDMFAQCVTKDPGNLVYVEAMVDNLIKKFNNNKKGGKQRGNRNAFKKAVAAESWEEVWSEGFDLLKHNPWDIPTLRALAEVCEKHRFNEVELRYLKTALEGNGKDIEINRHCATSLARMGQYDQAIACWHRIEDRYPQAAKMISDLTLVKNRPSVVVDLEDEDSRGRSGSASSQTKKVAEKPEDSPNEPKLEKPPSPRTQEELSAAIAESPAIVNNYLELAKLQDQEGEFAKAELTLQRALEVAGGDLKVRELMETAQIRRKGAQLKVAKQRAAKEDSQEHKDLVERFKDELNRIELQIYDARAQRYPDDLGIKHELAGRLKRSGNFAEAAKYYEMVAADEHRGSAATLNRGECLQQMRQYLDALRCYVLAAKTAEQRRQPDVEKLALYRAGMLAIGLKDSGKARNYLGKLVKMDPNYRDTQKRLDNLAKNGDT